MINMKKENSINLKLNNRYLVEYYPIYKTQEDYHFLTEVVIVDMTNTSYKLKDLLSNKFFWDYKKSFKQTTSGLYPGEYLIVEDLGEYREEKRVIPLHD
jgi:hypothetical protein